MKHKIFTMIELLIVIAIISILAGVLLPALNAARKKAQTIACVSQLKQAVQGVFTYTVDSDDWLPVTSEWSYQMVFQKYLPISASRCRIIGREAVFKVRCPMICPSISTPSASPAWPAGTPENEWSPSNYLPSVTTSDWGEEEKLHGWGWRQQTAPLRRISTIKSEVAMFGEFGYTGKNGSIRNALPNFYYYHKLSIGPANANQFLQHSPLTTNMAFFGGNVMTMKFAPGVEVLKKDFTVKK